MKKLSRSSVTSAYLLVAFAAGLVSCGGGGDDGNGNGGGEEQPWDKTRTAKVHVVSTLSEGNLFPGTNYLAVIGGVQSTDCHVTLLDRANVRVTENGMVNPGANVASGSGKVPLFVPIGVSADGYVGSTVLFDAPIGSIEQIRATDHCWLMRQDIDISTAIKMRFATISFTGREQIAPGVNAIKGVWTLQTLVVGVVEKSFVETFESAISSAITSGHVFELADGGEGDYHVYVLGSPRWKLREVTGTVKSGGIEGFLIQVEYLK